MKKINGKKKLLFHCFIASLFLALVYSRFVGLDWGLPYPMHPDERNMATAIQNLNCEISNFKFQISNFRECFNPRFFAYGQFPLYLGYLLIWILKGFKNFGSFIISFEEAVMSLRVISAIVSIINVFVLVKIINLILKKNQTLLIILILTFSPFFIQFSHFGTTESLLMLFYSLIVYLSMRLLERRTTDAVVYLALISGLAVATKISSVLFLVVPVIVLISKIKDHPRLKVLNLTFGFAFCTLVFALVFSPHNLINFQDFVSSIRYESDVALGKSLVFYTRQFFNTVPVWFQLTKVFPYVLGWPVFILASLGILGGLGWKDKKINLLRFAFLIYFLPTAFMFAKWSRFMAPIFPLMLVFAILFLEFLIFNFQFLFKFKFLKFISNFKFQISNLLIVIITLIMILPGIAYLSVYQNPDIRFQASEWIYKNIPNNSYILSETANVVDIPFSNGTMKQLNNYNVISFNFYDLDESPKLQSELKDHIEKADYIFVPSRRIFANLKNKYPLLNKYYDDLFSGKLGFEKVAEFSSELNDEAAEETWTVFDHPVIRIYKKVGVGLPDPYKSS